MGFVPYMYGLNQGAAAGKMALVKENFPEMVFSPAPLFSCPVVSAKAIGRS